MYTALNAMCVTPSVIGNAFKAVYTALNAMCVTAPVIGSIFLGVLL